MNKLKEGEEDKEEEVHSSLCDCRAVPRYHVPHQGLAQEVLCHQGEGGAKHKGGEGGAEEGQHVQVAQQVE